MKKIIIFFLLVFCISSFVEAQDAKNKIPINFGLGSSIRMGTLLFPSADALVSIGPVELSGFYKYSDAYETELHAIGAGIQLYLLQFGDDKFNLILSYDRTFTDSESDNITNSEGKFETLFSKENIFCIGIKSTVYKHSSVSCKVGISSTSGLQKNVHPRFEVHYCYYFKKGIRNTNIF